METIGRDGIGPNGPALPYQRIGEEPPERLWISRIRIHGLRRFHHGPALKAPQLIQAGAMGRRLSRLGSHEVGQQLVHAQRADSLDQMQIAALIEGVLHALLPAKSFRQRQQHFALGHGVSIQTSDSQQQQLGRTIQQAPRQRETVRHFLADQELRPVQTAVASQSAQCLSRGDDLHRQSASTAE